MAFVQNLRSRARRFNAPVTIFLVVSLLASSLYFWGARLSGFESVLLDSNWPRKVWTILTYPWAYMPYGDVLALLFFFFLLYWLWWSGSEVERALGSVKYAGLWLGSTFVGGMCMLGASKLVGVPIAYGGSWLPDAAVTIWWCALNPKVQVTLYGAIPVSTRFLAAMTAVILILVHGVMHPVIGFAAALHLIPVYFWANGKIPMPRRRASEKLSDRPYLKKSERMGEGYYDDVKKREKEREERERLRKLFESSLNDDQAEGK